MFIPLDYQLDQLKALHLLYHAFPPPVRITYYAFNNKTELSDVFDKIGGFIDSSLDPTSIATFNKYIDIPFYLATGGDSPKQQQSGEYGNVFTQSEISGYLPAILNLDFIAEEYIQFSSTNHTRLFKIVNIELNNINEMGDLRLYKIVLAITKYKDTLLIDSRINDTFKYSYNTNKLYLNDFENYINNILLPDLNFILSDLDTTSLTLESKHFLSKLYNDYKLVFNLLFSKYNYSQIDCFIEDYNNYPYVYFLDTPTGVSEVPGIAAIDHSNYVTMISDVNSETYVNHPYVLDNLITATETNSLSIQNYISSSNQIDKILGLYIILKHITKFI